MITRQMVAKATNDIHILYFGWGSIRELQTCLNFSGSASVKAFMCIFLE